MIFFCKIFKKINANHLTRYLCFCKFLGFFIKKIFRFGGYSFTYLSFNTDKTTCFCKDSFFVSILFHLYCIGTHWNNNISHCNFKRLSIFLSALTDLTHFLKFLSKKLHVYEHIYKQYLPKMDCLIRLKMVLV